MQWPLCSPTGWGVSQPKVLVKTPLGDCSGQKYFWCSVPKDKNRSLPNLMSFCPDTQYQTNITVSSIPFRVQTHAISGPSSWTRSNNLNTKLHLILKATKKCQQITFRRHFHNSIKRFIYETLDFAFIVATQMLRYGIIGWFTVIHCE